MQVCGPFKRLEKHFTHWNPWLDYAVRVVYQEPRGEKTAIENLQNLKTVFSEKGASKGSINCLPWVKRPFLSIKFNDEVINLAHGLTADISSLYTRA